MQIRNAEIKDIAQILRLLSQVLELHAALRPDVFVPGTTKYNEEELRAILRDASRRTYVAAEGDKILGYAMCEIREQPPCANLVPFTTLYVDDLCVDAAARGRGVGQALFEHAKKEAKQLGCYEVTLHVWEGNDGARAFYDKMGMKPKETQMEFIL